MHYQQKKQGGGGGNQSSAAAASQNQPMNAGPTQAWQKGSRHAPKNNNFANVFIDRKPVASSTEEGFTGPKEGWFDGK